MADTQEILLEITCPVYPDIQIESIGGHEELGGLFRYDLVLVSKDRNLDMKALLASPITVHLPLGDGKVRHFSGIVAAAARQREENNLAYYWVQLCPEEFLLTLSQNCRIFQNKTVESIAEELVKSHGLRMPWKSALFQTYRTWDYLTQYHESDWAFLRRILAFEGIYFYYNHLKNGPELVLVDSYTHHQPFQNFDEIPLHSQSESLRVPDYLREWQTKQEIQTNVVSLRDFEFRFPLPASILEEFEQEQPEPPFDEIKEKPLFECYDYPGFFTLQENQVLAELKKEEEEGTKLARVKLEAIQCKGNVFTGEGISRALRVGSIIKISNSLEYKGREFLITSTDLAFSNPIFGVVSSASERTRVRLTAIPRETQFRMPLSEKPVVKGPQTATVVGPAGEEIWTDEFGRIKVQFHWDRKGEFKEDSSCWIRVAQPWAGKKWGVIHIPRVGNEVVVEFLEGDPDRPLVTGSVYNADNPVPYPLPQNKTQSGVKTRSTKGATDQNFNEIRFEDLKGSEELHMQAERDMSTLVKRNQSTSVGADRSVSVGGNQSTTVTKKETQTYQDERVMTVAKTNLDEITGAHTGKYHAGRTETVENGDTLTVVKSNKITKVEGEYNIQAKTLYQVIQGENQILLKGDETIVNNGKCRVQMKGDDATVMAPNSLTLQCGGASIILKKDGTIEVNGSQKVEITGGGSKVALDATGADAKGTVIKLNS